MLMVLKDERNDVTPHVVCQPQGAVDELFVVLAAGFLLLADTIERQKDFRGREQGSHRGDGFLDDCRVGMGFDRRYRHHDGDHVAPRSARSSVSQRLSWRFWCIHHAVIRLEFAGQASSWSLM